MGLLFQGNFGKWVTETVACVLCMCVHMYVVCVHVRAYVWLSSE